ncbi:MAG: hypothetical protein Q8904_00145 [Bacteroidota bacterium]|nr:hypothetical protein [Bacteroidota bacterium]
MKRIHERNFFHGIFLACFTFLFLFLGTSCQKDAADDLSTKLVGTWHQTSQTINGIPAAKDSTRLLMQINANQICILCDSSAAAIKAKKIINRSGWSYTGGSFNIAIDLPASWSPVAEVNQLTLQRLDFNQTGGISKTTLQFERVTNIDIK